MRHFFIPTAVSVLVLGLIGFLTGFMGLFTALLLVVLEVTLSFDNAVVNARVLAQMSAVWQKRFLTWGMLIAVFGTRLVLPVLIVSAAAVLSPVAVAKLALFDPSRYAHLLEDARYAIEAFGGAFLLMVSLKYFFDAEKEVHWIRAIERRLSSWGRIEAVEIAVTLLTLLGFTILVPEEARTTVLAAGAIGIVLFIAMQGIASSFSVDAKNAAVHGLALFVYLNVLDSAFSLDSVVGAFALTTSLPIIAAGLGIGAWYVRSITVYLVERGTLNALTYLEHGAHWAIFGLAASMFAGLVLAVPEVVTGTVGLAFVLAAYWSSVRAKRLLA